MLVQKPLLLELPPSPPEFLVGGKSRAIRTLSGWRLANSAVTSLRRDRLGRGLNLPFTGKLIALGDETVEHPSGNEG